jgi:hypothetical protein
MPLNIGPDEAFPGGELNVRELCQVFSFLYDMNKADPLRKSYLYIWYTTGLRKMANFVLYSPFIQ